MIPNARTTLVDVDMNAFKICRLCSIITRTSVNDVVGIQNAGFGPKLQHIINVN